jgi:hypothetical protein
MKANRQTSVTGNLAGIPSQEKVPEFHSLSRSVEIPGVAVGITREGVCIQLRVVERFGGGN